VEGEIQTKHYFALQVPFIVDRFQPNFHCSQPWENSAAYDFSYITAMEGEGYKRKTTSSSFIMRFLRSQRMVSRGNDHILVLHHFVWHFVTVDCQQEAHHFKL
jgi:hypothetical protein